MKTVKSDKVRRLVLRHLRDTWIEPIDPAFPHSALVSRATYSPWYADTEFMTVFNIVETMTLVDIYRCHEIWDLIKQTERVAGDVIEIGVWKGGTGAIASRRLENLGSNRRVLLCDTFTGVVKAGAKDTLYQGGEHADTSREGVMGLMQMLAVAERIEILAGIFPEESAEAVENRRFSFCHIDVDTYLSAKDIFDWITPRLNQHGVVLFDDYGTWGCEGVSALVEELASRADYFLLRNLNGHAVFIKLTEADHV